MHVGLTLRPQNGVPLLYNARLMKVSVNAKTVERRVATLGASLQNPVPRRDATAAGIGPTRLSVRAIRI